MVKKISLLLFRSKYSSESRTQSLLQTLVSLLDLLFGWLEEILLQGGQRIVLGASSERESKGFRKTHLLRSQKIII